MTEEQFIRAIEINERIKELESVKKEINDSTNNKLSYAYKNCNADWTLYSDWRMNPIGDILDRHDDMIRQEIDGEIEKLKNEIKTL